MMRRVVPGLLAFALLTAPLGAQQAMDPLLAEGFDPAYNLDHEPAIAKLRQAIAERPDDPAPHRGTAAIAWLRILYLRGGILVDNYMTGSVTRPGGKLEKPPPELDELFHTHLARAVELSEGLCAARARRCQRALRAGRVGSARCFLPRLDRGRNATGAA